MHCRHHHGSDLRRPPRLIEIHNLSANVGSGDWIRVGARLSGPLRVVYRTPDWEDFVMLRYRKYFQFCGNSTQVVAAQRAIGWRTLIPYFSLLDFKCLRQETLSLLKFMKY